MQLHEIQPQHQNKAKARVGRGGKRGTFSGRGVKGQKSRAGRKMQPSMREAIKRYHKLRGYRQVLRPKLTASITLESLEKAFQAGERVTPAILLSRRIIRNIEGKMPIIKILAKGQITKKLNIEGCSFSPKAKEAIEKAGGAIIRNS